VGIFLANSHHDDKRNSMRRGCEISLHGDNGLRTQRFRTCPAQPGRGPLAALPAQRRHVIFGVAKSDQPETTSHRQTGDPVIFASQASVVHLGPPLHSAIENADRRGQLSCGRNVYVVGARATTFGSVLEKLFFFFFPQKKSSMNQLPPKSHRPHPPPKRSFMRFTKRWLKHSLRQRASCLPGRK